MKIPDLKLFFENVIFAGISFHSLDKHFYANCKLLK